MWEDHLQGISIAKRRIELMGNNTFSIHCKRHRVGLNVGELERMDFEKVMVMNAFEITKTEWVSPILLALKNGDSLWFGVYYQKLNYVAGRKSYPLPKMVEFIDSLSNTILSATRQSPDHKTQTIATGKWK